MRQLSFFHLTTLQFICTHHFQATQEDIEELDDQYWTRTNIVIATILTCIHKKTMQLD